MKCILLLIMSPTEFDFNVTEGTSKNNLPQAQENRSSVQCIFTNPVKDRGNMLRTSFCLSFADEKDKLIFFLQSSDLYS